MGPGSAAHRCRTMLRIDGGTPRRVRGTNVLTRSDSFCRHTFAFSRLVSPELCSLRCALLLRKGAGKAGCRLAPAVPCAKKTRTGRTTGEPGNRPSLRGWFYGLCRALLGERCTIAPVALRMADALARLGRHITATLDAQTPGVRTTRFCRRAHPRPCLRWLACARHRDRTRTLSAPCRIARAAAHGNSRPAACPARRRRRGHRLPARVS